MTRKRLVILWPAVGDPEVAAAVIDGALVSMDRVLGSGGALDAAASLTDAWDGVSVPAGWRAASRSERRYLWRHLEYCRELMAEQYPREPDATLH